jgi:hypothetical protein
MANQTSKQRLTKAERKDEARRQRVELQRKMAAAKRNRRIAIAVVVVLVAGTGAYVLTRPKPAEASPQELLAAAPQATKSAGCGQVRDVGPFQPKSQDRAHVTAAIQLSQYASVPPASGPHNPIPLGAGVYNSPPAIDRAIHSLEHGAAIVWYSPDASSAEVDKIKAFYGRNPVGTRVIVAPYDYPDQGPAGSLPPGTQMALVAWHHVQTCAQANAAAAFGFTSVWSAPPFTGKTYKGDAPEAGAAF